MAKPRARATATTEELVRQALLTIAETQAPLRLCGKGPDALLPSAGGANRAVIAALKDQAQPLITETREGEKPSLKLTAAGFALISRSIPRERIAGVVQRFLRRLPAKEQVNLLQQFIQQQPEMSPLLLPLWETALQNEQSDRARDKEVLEQERTAEAAVLAALERYKTLLLARKAERIQFLRSQLHAEGIDEEVDRSLIRSATSRVAQGQTPRSSEEIDFRRQVARRLVSSWQDAWEAHKHEAREFLEAAIWNISGFRCLGVVGQLVRFDGRYHEGGGGLFTDDSVRIVRPGWLLDEPHEHEYIILKATVAKA